MTEIRERGLFVTFEGLEGGGKTTVLEEMAVKLGLENFPVVKTRVPGETEFGEKVREQLFSIVNELLRTSYIGPETLSDTYIQLWFKAYTSVVEEIIGPSVESGKIVLRDRFSDSGLVFFGYGAKRDLEELKSLIRHSDQSLTPDLTIWFDLPLELGLARKGFIYGPRTLEYYRDVERGYHTLYSGDQ